MTSTSLLAELQSLWQLQPVTPKVSLDSDPIEWTPAIKRNFDSAMRFFENIAEEMSKHNPDGLGTIFPESEPMANSCFRCNGTKSYVAVIHDGESLRRDCAKCGRFVEFATWHDRDATNEAIKNLTTTPN